MVEAMPEESPHLEHGSHSPRGSYFALQSESHEKDDNFDSTPQEYFRLHDNSDLVTPTVLPRLRGSFDEEIQDVEGQRMAESSKSDKPKTRSQNDRRRSRPQHDITQQSSGLHSYQPSDNTNYMLPSSATFDSSSSFQGPPAHNVSSSMSNENQRSGYVGQYTQSNPMVVPPHPPYATYHNPVGTDISNINVHANYPHTLQPQAPFLPFQRPSLEGSFSTHHSFHGTRSPPMYGAQQSSSQSLSHPTPSGQSSGLGTSYLGFNTFQSLQYTTPMATSPYPYAARTYPSSPLYSPQLPPPPFGQHYSPPPEFEQGTWFYLPHPPQPDTSQYQGLYPAGYPQIRHPNTEVVSGRIGRFSFNTSQSLSPPYQNLPTQPPQLQYPAIRTSSDSSGPSGVGLSPLQGPSRDTTRSASSNSNRPPASGSDRVVVRRSYHPNPPAHRSEWVMWAGNVPSDVTHDELWRFFNQPPPSSSSPATPSPSRIQISGVLSIFLISRSSCAFVNYDTEANLQQAIARFNGVRLRAHDSRCPRLLCRVRRKDDDLKAGVGGQRGMGMHTNWVKEHNTKGKEKARDTYVEDSSPDNLDSPMSPTSTSDRLTNAVSNISIAGDVHATHSSSSGSYTSTNSSFLAKYFPRRYFILKSLSQQDLDLSVARSAWATQKHNEEILDQAYRSSRDVYLIFSVNKSGEFYGYARMSGPVQRGEHRMTWASRPAPVTSVSSPGRLSHPVSSIPINPHSIENPSEPAGSSTPGPASVQRAHKGVKPASIADTGNPRHSAPALLRQGYHLPSGTTLPDMRSLDHRARLAPQAGNPSGSFVLDPDAPTRAMRANTGSSSTSGPRSGSEQDKVDAPPSQPSLQSVEEEEEKGDGDQFDSRHQDEYGEEDFGVDDETENPPDDPVPVMEIIREPAVDLEEEVWGDTFAVQWVCTDRVSFHRTKHLRNSWNHDREIKISRDGTELEPSVGQRLLEEWGSLADSQNRSPSHLSRTSQFTVGGKKATDTMI